MSFGKSMIYLQRITFSILVKSAMSKKVESATVSLWEVLATTTPYMIPFNQRPYTWELKNWEALWNSFFSENDKSIFLGSFIFLRDEDPEKDIQIFDGQQRITTLTIMCKAFIDVLYTNNFKDEASTLKNYLMTDYKGNPRLNVSKNIKDYFVSNIQNKVGLPAQQGKSSIEKNIFKGYNYFFNEASQFLEANKNNGAEVFKIYKNRLSHLEVVKLEISDIILGIEIFESVNATGKQLNASELAKNVLIKHAEILKQDIAAIDEKWNEINNRLLKTGFSFIEFMFLMPFI